MNKERFEKIRALSPMEAIQVLYDGTFGIGDEPAVVEAIQKDPRVLADEDEIIDIVLAAMEEESEPFIAFQRLCDPDYV